MVRSPPTYSDRFIWVSTEWGCGAGLVEFSDDGGNALSPSEECELNAQTSPPPLLSLLGKLRKRGSFNAIERDAVLALPCTVETAPARKHILRAGGQSDHSCFLLSGFAIRVKIVADGSRSITAIYMRGDLINLHNSMIGIVDHSVQALDDCTVGFIPREAIRKLAFEVPSVGMALWYDTFVDASIYREWIANIARRKARARLAHLLCELGVRLEAAGLGNKLSYQLPLSQEHLADCAGLTPVHVNRTLKELELSGDITRTAREVAIADWGKIRETGDFNEEYLQLRDQSIAA